eukprot:12338596-Alexandrium_andersonii.AAC.1
MLAMEVNDLLEDWQSGTVHEGYRRDGRDASPTDVNEMVEDERRRMRSRGSASSTGSVSYTHLTLPTICSV